MTVCVNLILYLFPYINFSFYQTHKLRVKYQFLMLMCIFREFFSVIIVDFWAPIIIHGIEYKLHYFFRNTTQVWRNQGTWLQMFIYVHFDYNFFFLFFYEGSNCASVFFSRCPSS